MAIEIVGFDIRCCSRINPLANEMQRWTINHLKQLQTMVNHIVQLLKHQRCAKITALHSAKAMRFLKGKKKLKTCSNILKRTSIQTSLKDSTFILHVNKSQNVAYERVLLCKEIVPLQPGRFLTTSITSFSRIIK